MANTNKNRRNSDIFIDDDRMSNDEPWGIIDDKVHNGDGWGIIDDNPKNPEDDPWYDLHDYFDELKKDDVSENPVQTSPEKNLSDLSSAEIRGIDDKDHNGDGWGMIDDNPKNPEDDPWYDLHDYFDELKKDDVPENSVQTSSEKNFSDLSPDEIRDLPASKVRALTIEDVANHKDLEQVEAFKDRYYEVQEAFDNIYNSPEFDKTRSYNDQIDEFLRDSRSEVDEVPDLSIGDLAVEELRETLVEVPGDYPVEISELPTDEVTDITKDDNPANDPWYDLHDYFDEINKDDVPSGLGDDN